MDFGFSVTGLLIGRKYYRGLPLVKLTAEEREKLKEIVDTFGWHSSQGQGLSRPVTDYNRLKSGDHQLLLICKPHWMRGIRVIGGLKCGTKHLFFKKDEAFVEVEPMCVLDFYVHERYQRKGYGHRLFQRFLRMTNEDPSTIAYDRPSSKLLAFLMKYYGCPQLVYSHLAQTSSSLQCSSGMTRSIQHNNNFAVFESFLENAGLRKVKMPGKRIGRKSRSSSGLTSFRSVSRQNSLQSLSPIKDECTESGSTCDSFKSNHSSLQGDRSSRASSQSIEQKSLDSSLDRAYLKSSKKQFIGEEKEMPSLTRMSLGPYPGFQFPTSASAKSLNRDRNQDKKEPNGLTRLSVVESPPHNKKDTKAPCCIPPWATGFPLDKKIFPAPKLTCMSLISTPSADQNQDSQNSAYSVYRRRSLNAVGVKNCLRWGR